MQETLVRFPGLGRSPGEGIGYPLQYSWNAGDPGSIPGSGSSPGEGLGYPLQCSWNAGDPGSIPGLGSSPREGIGYPLQCFWASVVAQLVKNPPARWVTWVRSLAWEDPLEEGMATHSSILAWRIPMDRGPWWATIHGVAESWTRLSD